MGIVFSKKGYFDYTLRIVVAVIFVQSLYYKFSGHEEAIHIFSTIGMEPWGRILVGVSEMVVAVFIVFPPTKLLGSLGAVVLMAGAVLFHLFTPLGIIVRWNDQNDGGLLFGMAVLALICSLLSICLNISQYKEDILEFLSVKKYRG